MLAGMGWAIPHGEESRRDKSRPDMCLRRQRDLTPPRRQISHAPRRVSNFNSKSIRKLCSNACRGRIAVPKTSLHDQNQSPLFGLPHEVRRRIWKHVLGRNHIHISHKHKHLIHMICQEPENFGLFQRRQHKCWGKLVPEKWHNGICFLEDYELGQELFWGMSDGQVLKKTNFLGLLSTCRMM